MTLDWLIIYGDKDRSVFSSKDGPWAKAPPWNAQIVAIPSQTGGRELLSRNDHFIMVDNHVLNVNDDGFLDHMLNVLSFAMVDHVGYPTVYVLTKSGRLVDREGLLLASVEAGITKVGRYLSTEEFRPLLRDAVAAKGLPLKSAWLRHERRVSL